MQAKICPCFVIFIGALCMSVGQPNKNNESGIAKVSGVDGGGSIQLLFLGTVDGKSYFTDDSYKNWKDARAYCTTFGMHIATITSKDQWELLVSAFNSTTFKGHYWISLRDAQEPRQFMWDTLETEPSASIGLVWDDEYNPILDEFYTCVSYYSWTSLSQRSLHVEYCSWPRGVLCET